MSHKEIFDSIKPLNRESVSSSIMNMIFDYLLSKRLKSGDKLPTENEFSQMLGVGRNSVREAIKMLSSFGVIEVRRGIGTFITKTISTPMINPLILGLVFEQGKPKDLIELRLLIEIGITQLVIEKASEEDIKKLVRANNKMKEAASKNLIDSQRLRDLDLSFHNTLIEITRNPFVVKIAKAIYRLFFASIEQSVKTDPILAYRNHQSIIDGIRKRDNELIGNIIRKSLSIWVEKVD